MAVFYYNIYLEMSKIATSCLVDKCCGLLKIKFVFLKLLQSLKLFERYRFTCTCCHYKQNSVCPLAILNSSIYCNLLVISWSTALSMKHACDALFGQLMLLVSYFMYFPKAHQDLGPSILSSFLYFYQAVIV